MGYLRGDSLRIPTLQSRGEYQASKRYALGFMYGRVYSRAGILDGTMNVKSKRSI